MRHSLQAAAPAMPDLEAFRAQRRRIFYPKTDAVIPDSVLQSLRQQSNAALGLTPPLLDQACRQAFGVAPLSVEPLAQQGTFHRLFRLVREDGACFILRVNALSDYFRDYSLGLEAAVIEQVRRQGIPAPQVVYVDTSRARCPFDFQLLEEVTDRSLRDFDDDEPALQRLLRALGAQVAVIHTIALHGYGLLDVGALATPDALPGGLFASWPEYVCLELEAHIECCQRIGALSPNEARRVAKRFAEQRVALAQPVLLHGDLGSHNAFTDGETITALIDWEDCLAGDPVYDIAFWATFHPERRHAAFLDGYRSVRALPTDFAARFWLYFLRASLAKTVHRHRFGYQDRPDRPPPAQRLQLALGRLEQALA